MLEAQNRRQCDKTKEWLDANENAKNVSSDQNGDENNQAERLSRQVTIPDICDMDHYAYRHYTSYIVAAINEKLVAGDLSEMFDVVIVSQEARKEDCHFTNLTYWRVDRTDFILDVDVQVNLSVEQGMVDMLQPFNLYVSLLIDEDLECNLNEIGRLADKPDRDAWKLDRFLTPILRAEEIEQAAESIWMEKCPAALEDASLRKARPLAGMYGLKILPLRLSRRKGTRSILFFREGTILVQDEKKPEDDEIPAPRTVTVPANTIVMNILDESADGGELDVFHECVHYDWHYLFYRLQNMYSDDVQLIRTRKIIIEKSKEPANPINFMEAQANRGSYALMMPISVMREKVYREFQRASVQRNTSGYFKHEGWKYDFVGRMIADEFQLRKYRVRARLLMLGYLAAKGALNYADGRYIVPFAFSSSYADKSNDTYVIDRKGIKDLYERDKKFRGLMARGDYVYVDGHLCYNSAEFIRMTSEGARLTPWANAHVDCCCLRFNVVYIKERTPEYLFGTMNSDEEYDRYYNEYLDRTLTKTAKERIEAKNKLMAGMPLSFHEALEYLMSDHGNGKVTVVLCQEKAQNKVRDVTE